MTIERIPFEAPIPTNAVQPFEGYVCVAITEKGYGISGCDSDSARDAYNDAECDAEFRYLGAILPHTVQMFRVG
jgi:hypothetical protein